MASIHEAHQADINQNNAGNEFVTRVHSNERDHSSIHQPFQVLPKRLRVMAQAIATRDTGSFSQSSAALDYSGGRSFQDVKAKIPAEMRRLQPYFPEQFGKTLEITLPENGKDEMYAVVPIVEEQSKVAKIDPTPQEPKENNDSTRSKVTLGGRTVDLSQIPEGTTCVYISTYPYASETAIKMLLENHPTINTIETSPGLQRRFKKKALELMARHNVKLDITEEKANPAAARPIYQRREGDNYSSRNPGSNAAPETHKRITYTQTPIPMAVVDKSKPLYRIDFQTRELFTHSASEPDLFMPEYSNNKTPESSNMEVNEDLEIALNNEFYASQVALNVVRVAILYPYIRERTSRDLMAVVNNVLPKDMRITTPPSEADKRYIMDRVEYLIYDSCEPTKPKGRFQMQLIHACQEAKRRDFTAKDLVQKSRNHYDVPKEDQNVEKNGHSPESLPIFQPNLNQDILVTNHS